MKNNKSVFIQYNRNVEVQKVHEWEAFHVRRDERLKSNSKSAECVIFQSQQRRMLFTGE